MPTVWTDPVLVARQTPNKSIHIVELREAVNNLELAVGDSSLMNVSVDAPNLHGEALVDELQSWGGQCRSYTQPAASMAEKVVAYKEVTTLRYFAYSFAVRMRVSDISATNIVKLKVSALDDFTWVTLSETTLTGNLFPSADQFYVAGIGFNYSVATDNKVLLEVISLPVSGLKVDVDCFVVQPAQVALYMME
jgi:hypothetical protein